MGSSKQGPHLTLVPTQPWAWHGGDLALVSLPAQSVHCQGARCQRWAQEPSPRLLGEGDVAGLKINPFPRGVDPSAPTQRASPLRPGCYGPALCSLRGARRPAGCSEGTEPGAEGRSTLAASRLSFQPPGLIPSPGLPRPSRGT